MSIRTYERARKYTQNKIVDATIDLLIEEGYDKLNISRVADYADIGRGTFYRYFESVDAVLLHVFSEISRGMYEEIGQILQKYESPEREKQAWIFAFVHLERYMPLFRELDKSSLALWEGIATQNLTGFANSLRNNDVLYTEWMDLPLDVMAHFTSGAIMSLMRAWFSGDLAYSGEEMGIMVFKLLYHRPN